MNDATRYLVGGVNSPVRAFRAVRAPAIMAAKGHGSWLIDVRGWRFIDLVMGWGALILGHQPVCVNRALSVQLRRGVCFGLTHEAEGELARLINEAVPSIKKVRFTPSGTEACMTAIRLARAHTRRTKVLKFEGCYHGHSDGMLGKQSAGVPTSIAAETLVAPFNDLTALEEIITRFGDQLACVIIEPIPANMGVIIPDPEWLRRLRVLTIKCGAVLIFDEVVTGFRVAYGGAQTLLRIMPDLTTLGKIIGGGLPIGAVGGSRRLMRRLAPTGDVYHAGTFAGHPLAMAAGIATLKELARANVYQRLEAVGASVAEGLQRAANRAGVALQVNRVGSMMTAYFCEEPVRCFEDARRAHAARFRALANGLRQRGVLLPPSPFEAWFLSVAHTPAMMQRMVQHSADILRKLN